MNRKESTENTFAKAIRRYMELYGLTQQEFARLVHTDKSNVSKWLNGQGARQDTVDQVAERLGMTPWQLLMYADDSPEYELPQHVRALAHRFARMPVHQQKAILTLIQSLESLTPDAAMIATAV